MSIIIVSGRRRTPGEGGYRASIAPADMEYHGAGYPITYRFTVPDQAGLVAQWRGATTQWFTLPNPSGRFDGINAARFAGTDAYLSVAFIDGQPDLWLRVIDAQGDEVGTFAEIMPWYDDRVPVIFTYDDTRSAIPAALATHREHHLWASVGINAAPDRWIGGTSPEQFALDVAAGYFEPVNHSYSHRSATTYTSAADADTEITGGAEAILAISQGPPQSRGRIHAFITPHNHYHSTYSRPAIVRAKHLTYRNTGTDSWATGVYVVSPGVELYKETPSVSTEGRLGNNVTADEFIAGVQYGVTNRLRCLLYSYTYDWTGHILGSPFYRMISTIGARTDIWSVGYGHYALYLKTASQVTITPPP